MAKIPFVFVSLVLAALVAAGCIDVANYFAPPTTPVINETGKLAGEYCESGYECRSYNCNYTTNACEPNTLSGYPAQPNATPQQPAASQPVTCGEAGAYCITGAQCCSLNCNYTVNQCAAEPLGGAGSCKPAGEVCISGGDCCSQNCNYTTYVCEANPLTPPANATPTQPAPAEPPNATQQPASTTCTDSGDELTTGAGSGDHYYTGSSQGTYNGAYGSYTDSCTNGVSTDYKCAAPGTGGNSTVVSTTFNCGACNAQGTACSR